MFEGFYSCHLPIWRDICCAMWTSVTWNDDPCNGEYISIHNVRQKCNKSKFHSTMVTSLCSRNGPDQSNLGTHQFLIYSKLTLWVAAVINQLTVPVLLRSWTCDDDYKLVQSPKCFLAHSSPPNLISSTVVHWHGWTLEKVEASTKEVGSQVRELDLFHHLFSPLQWPTFSKSEVRNCKLQVSDGSPLAAIDSKSNKWYKTVLRTWLTASKPRHVLQLFDSVWGKEDMYPPNPPSLHI